MEIAIPEAPLRGAISILFVTFGQFVAHFENGPDLVLFCHLSSDDPKFHRITP